MSRQAPPPPPGFVIQQPEAVPPPPLGFVLQDATEPAAAEQPDVRPGALREFMAAIAPSWRQAFRIGGAGIGGAIGFAGSSLLGTPIAGPGGAWTGGTAGGAAGEALWQIMSHLRGAEDAPTTPEEAIGGLNEAAIQGGLQEVVGAPAARGARGVLQRGAERRTVSALEPSTLAHKAEARAIAPKLSERLPVSGSSEALLTKFKSGMDDAGRALEAAYAKIPEGVEIQTADIVKALEASRRKLFMRGQRMPGSKQQVQAFDKIIMWLKQYPNLTVSEMRQNRQLWDQLVRWGRTPGASKPAKEAVFEEAANLLRGSINDRFTHVGDANDAYHLWSTAAGILERAELGATNRAALTVKDAVAGATGGLIAGTTGGVPAGGAAAGVMLLRRAMSHPAWKTVSVAIRRQVIKALDSGVGLQEAIGILTGAGATRAGTMLRSSDGQ